MVDEPGTVRFTRYTKSSKILVKHNMMVYFPLLETLTFTIYSKDQIVQKPTR